MTPANRVLGRWIRAALTVAIIGSTLVAAGECCAAVWVTAKHFHGGWPIGLIFAAFGRSAITHLLLWCPLLVLVAVGRWLPRRGGTASQPEPLLAALFVLAVGVIVAPADLELGHKDTPLLIVAAIIGSVVLAIGTYVSVRAVGKWTGNTRSLIRRVVNVAAGVCALAILGSFTSVVRSPFFNPGGYRVVEAGEHAPVADARTAARPQRGMTNVLWIVLDTVRADRMSVHGYHRKTTPFLERFSSRSVVFDRAISDGIWTLPSHASMFTGLSPRQHGASHKHRSLNESFTTVAEVLRDNGYRTALFSNNPFISPDTALVQGFDTHHVIYHLRHLTRFSLEYLCEKLGIAPPFPWLDRDFGAAMTNQMLSQWLDERTDEGVPFFLFVNYMEAHLPYAVPLPYRKMFMSAEQVKRSYELRYRAYGGIMLALVHRFNIEGSDFLPMSDREVLRRQYEACLRYLDDRVAELIGAFKRRGLLDRTLVVIASDHGEYLGTHGMWSHRFLAYNDLVHVSLILHHPDRREPGRISTPVQLSDLYATVLRAVLGADAPSTPGGGQDLFTVAARGGEPRIVISEYTDSAPGPEVDPKDYDNPVVLHRFSPQIAAQDGRFKYIASSDGQRELYDLSTDPGELNNLIEELPEEARRFTSHIRRWLEAVPLYRPPSSQDDQEMDPDILDALRSLGYLD